MLPTTLLRQAQPASSVSASVLKLLPKLLPPALNPPKNGNIHQILSRTPHVEGLIVHQRRWSEAGVKGSFWKVTRAEFKCEGKHGKVWGIPYWRGEKKSSTPERIRGALKHTWALGPSSPAEKTALPVSSSMLATKPQTKLPIKPKGKSAARLVHVKPSPKASSAQKQEKSKANQ